MVAVLPRIFVVMLLVILGCSPTAQEVGNSGGSEALGRYSPSLVQKNGQVKACFDRAGMTSRDLEFLPSLQTRLFQALVERTEGVINPFPPRSKVLPWCEDGEAFAIRISLLGNISDRTAPEFAGLNYPNCSRVHPVSTANNSYSISPSNDPQQTCAIVFTKVVYATKGQTKENTEARILRLLLHEMLHSYGIEHEMWHPGMPVAARERGTHMQNCVAKYTAPAVAKAQSQRELNAEVFGRADPDSVMNYCAAFFSDPKSQVRLSDGDVSLLLKLYGNGKAPTQNAAPPAKTATWESQTQSVAECSQYRANDVDFSQGWKTSYVLVEKNGAWEVTVTGVSRSDGRTEDWKTHPVGDAAKADSKFATYIDQARRILEHRTPQGSVLKIEMACQ